MHYVIFRTHSRKVKACTNFLNIFFVYPDFFSNVLQNSFNISKLNQIKVLRKLITKYFHLRAR